jgi:hypothetical protein
VREGKPMRPTFVVLRSKVPSPAEIDGEIIDLGRFGSSRVRVCLAASKATRALKAAECRFSMPATTLLGVGRGPPIG